jgi:hypothetical protein
MAWNEEVKSENLLAVTDAVADAIYAIVGPPKTLVATDDHVHQGFYAETTLATVDTDLVAANIKHDVNIFGVVGTYDASAVPITVSTVSFGLEGFVNGAKITGEMPVNTGNVAAVSAHMDATTVLHVVPATGFTDGVTDATVIDLTTVDADLITTNIKTGITILGVAGTSTVVDVADTTAVAADVAAGTYFYTAAGVRTEGTHV